MVVMFSKGKGKPKQDALEVKAAIDAKSLDGVFLATNNLTYAAGVCGPASSLPCLGQRTPRVAILH